ncbi:DinB family protein [Cesiribacter sp. SM1]|uniref:DinB family protein n=1 Tax=Cesiribacter sp. SM1 TaxID=2861196 RepID=UPI001CD7300A|nr:DinB family protein [Cesiribacter sp. SM1]
MESLFKDWFAYNHEANQRTIEVLLKEEQVPDKAMEIFNHVLNAHQIWLNRIYGTNLLQVSPWQSTDKAYFSEYNDLNYRNTLLLLQASGFGMHLGKPVNYQNTKGELFTNNIQEIYFHILTHSAYHRGQIAFLLRQAGAIPPLTDFIFYKRDLPLKSF